METECMHASSGDCGGAVKLLGFARTHLEYPGLQNYAPVVLCGKHNGEFEAEGRWPWLELEVDVKGYALQVIASYSLESDPARYSDQRLAGMDPLELYRFIGRAEGPAYDSDTPAQEGEAWRARAAKAQEYFEERAEWLR